MATKLQRHLLWLMIEHGNQVLIYTGQRSTEWGTNKQYGLVIKGCDVVLLGLTANRWIEPNPDPFYKEHARFAYRITDAGIKAAGRRKPEIKPVRFGKMGVRWG